MTLSENTDSYVVVPHMINAKLCCTASSSLYFRWFTYITSICLISPLHPHPEMALIQCILMYLGQVIIESSHRGLSQLGILWISSAWQSWKNANEGLNLGMWWGWRHLVAKESKQMHLIKEAVVLMQKKTIISSMCHKVVVQCIYLYSH